MWLRFKPLTENRVAIITACAAARSLRRALKRRKLSSMSPDSSVLCRCSFASSALNSRIQGSLRTCSTVILSFTFTSSMRMTNAFAFGETWVQYFS